ncbi:AraC-type DNA-binding protein [Friedmanniella luteola]|uniref:AraC-type DNA-binding protein n=1 Tax=Friedmanniella luteola TaxID=546871 RepID=A0A1H1R067_9ACTN|nr:helix-turn-helix domain-containing protein [Friedmanniella luteola]SDS29000.1 AraC-type DNA-binding protein [Friedmanniella luteola]
MPDWKDASGPAPVRGLVRRAASTDAFRTARFPPGPALAPWVDYLWTVDWDLGDAAPVESRVISFPALHLTAESGTPGEVRHGQAMPATLLHGAVSRVFQVRLSGAGWVVGARFHPDGAHPWTRTDAAALRDRAVPASTLPGPLPADLHTDLAGLPPDARARAFAAALAPHRPDEPGEDPALTALVRRIEADAGLVRVEQLVELAGCSVRTLQRRFRRHLGVSPKWVLARFRLQEAALALEQEPEPDLADLAVRLGWYDQAHLTNDLRRMLGETPARYAARAHASAR